MESDSFSVVVKPEALKQLIELGVEKNRAHEALSKYNNDVERAADFYFQNFQNNFQNTNSDDTMNNLTPLTDWEESTTPRNDSDNNTSTIDLTGNDPELNSAIEASIKDQNEDDLKRGINASLKETSPRSSSAVNNMAVVLYKNDVNKNDNNSQTESWPWLDPEQPIKRVKLDTTPLGLKPIMSHGYTCSFFQALFHIPIFRLAILAYRPTRNDWGEVDGYWSGKSQGLSIEDDYSIDSYSPEFKSRQFTMKFMHEFQKIFGFLSLSQRTYGDASLLMNALDYEETRKGWGDEWEVAIQDFVSRMLDVIVGSLSYRDLIDFGISDSLSKYIIPFDKLLKSVCRNESFRRYDAYHYQSEKKDEEVLNIPLEITPSYNTIYAALDQLVRNKPSQKVFFIHPAKILILNIKHRVDYADNSFTSGNSIFHIDKELYMDRYLLDRAEDIEKRWCQLEGFKLEFEKIDRDIRNITEYQGRHNGSDLLKGSIDYFRRKCDKARNIGFTDEVAQNTCSFLEGVLEKVEQKLKVLLEKREEIEARMKDIFNTPDMKRVVYRLKAVLLSDGQYGQAQHYAYIWVSRGNKTETISSNNENGTWWKFCDTIVEERFEEQVLNDTSGLHVNSGVHTLIYVNADVDCNFPNMNDLIPTSLKEYVEKDNRMLDEVVSNYDYSNNNYTNNNDYTNNDDYTNNNDYTNNDDYTNNNDYTNNDDYTNNNDYSNNDDYTNYTNNDNGNDYTNTTEVRDLMDTSGDSDKKIEFEIEIIIEQAENMGPLNPNINKRFEVFCIRLGKIDLFKSLLRRYYDISHVDVSWDEPRPLNKKYRDDSQFKEYVNLFNKYKGITLCFAEGLERVNSDEYRNALAYFKYAINLENDWINQLNITDSDGKLVILNGEKLRRSKEIDAYARACLKVEHEGFLGKIRSKMYVTRGLKDGLQILPYIVGYIGALNCLEDELFKQFRDEFQECLKTYDEKFTEEQEELLHKLNEEYMRPKESLELKLIEDIDNSGSLYTRYKEALKSSSSSLKKYDENISSQ